MHIIGASIVIAGSSCATYSVFLDVVRLYAFFSTWVSHRQICMKVKGTFPQLAVVFVLELYCRPLIKVLRHILYRLEEALMEQSMDRTEQDTS